MPPAMRQSVEPKPEGVHLVLLRVIAENRRAAAMRPSRLERRDIAERFRPPPGRPPQSPPRQR